MKTLGLGIALLVCFALSPCTALAAENTPKLVIRDAMGPPSAHETLRSPRIQRSLISDLRQAERLEVAMKVRDPFQKTRAAKARSGGFVPGWEVPTADTAGSPQGRSPGWRPPRSDPPGPEMTLNDRLYLKRRRSILGDNLPLWKDKLDERGIPFMLPLGASFQWSYVEQLSEIRDLKIGTNGGELKNIDDFLEVSPDTVATAATLRFDVWVFPFLNIFALVGSTTADSSTTITVDRLLPNRPTVTVDLPLKRTGPAYGIGVVLAGGIGPFFGSFSANRSVTEFEGTSKIDVSVYSLRVGWKGDVGHGGKLAVWLGATYWDTERKLTGSATLDSGDRIDFELVQGPVTDWHPILGIRYDYRGMFEGLLEIGAYKDRRFLTVGVTGRF